MSGIFGVVDRVAPPDKLEVLDAARSIDYRGNPEAFSAGAMVAGIYRRPEDREQPWLHEGESSLLVADARVDGTVGGSSSLQGLAVLEEALRSRGPLGLNDVAADFALAHLDASSGTLVLARDVFCLRPLYWATRGSRLGFAADPAVLIALGLADGALDRDAVITYLYRLDTEDERSGFRGVYRLPGGHCLRWRDDSFALGRWFRPERTGEQGGSLEHHAGLVREAVLASVVSRARGRRVALSLSGGRDSGAVAVALAESGVTADCLTYVYPEPEPYDEAGPAHDIATAHGHEVVQMALRPWVEPEEIEWLPSFVGGPLGPPAFPLGMAMFRSLESCGAQVLMDGQWGEPLFSAAPVAPLDLMRRGRIRAAARAARSFDHEWIYGYPVLAKAAIRAAAPRSLLRIRERRRPDPPWLPPPPPPPDLGTAPRSHRAFLLDSLSRAAFTSYVEMTERLYQPLGVEYAPPYLDMRVVTAALQAPLQTLIPLGGAKPLLRAAFLGEWDSSRVKARNMAFLDGLAASIHDRYPAFFSRESLATQEGYVIPEGLPATSLPLWRFASITLLGLETWLRTMRGVG